MARRASSSKEDKEEFTFSRRRLSEALGIGLWASALFLLIALFTFHSSDPSWNHAAPGPIANWGGLAGAFLADLVLQFIGLAGFVLVLVLGVWGWRFVREHHVSYAWARFSALLVGLALAATLLSAMPAPEAWPFPQGLGGSIGAVLRYHLQPIVTLPGLTLISLLLGVITLWFALALTAEEWSGLWQLLLYVCSAVIAFFSRILSRDPVLVEEKPARRRRRAQQEDEEDDEENEPRSTRRYDKLIESKKDVETVPQASLQLKQRPGRARKGTYQFPSLELLNMPSSKSRNKQSLNEEALTQNAKLLESVLQDFGVNGEVVKVRPGPVVTLYELEPSPGTKSSRVIGLSDDIARSMSATSARIAVIPGRNAIGIELPNPGRETVHLRELLEHDSYTGTEARLPLALGKDIGGEGTVVDLSRMPHLLVAGTTGSGKSVAINTMILSLIYRLSPEECKFIMIDPKMLELSVYEGIPHLLSSVVTEPGKAVVALKWVVREMENRYRLMSNLGVRNIEGYNKRIREAASNGEELTRTVQTGFDPETGKPIMEDVPLDMNPLPFIVVIVDEMADLMITAGKDVESSIQRLAQMARAAGIHIIMATQRPSVDVITGVVKANFPTRISFQVTSKIDSRTVLGEQGAEQLLGQGDMLYMAGGGRITRVHGPFVSDKEVEVVVKHLKTQGAPVYLEEVTQEDENAEDGSGATTGDGDDQELYEQAVAIVRRDRKASTSYIQRHLKIGYNRAARLIDRMEAEGIVGMANHVGKREVLVR